MAKLQLTANEAAILAFVQNYPNSENVEKLLLEERLAFVALARKAQLEARFKIADRGSKVLTTEVCKCRCGNLHRKL